jgi:hypothetical protein
VEVRTKLRPSQIALAVAVVLTLALLLFQTAALVLSVSCFVVPGYFSLGCLNSNDPHLNAKYLTYWVVFSVTEVVGFVPEYFMGTVIYVLVRILLTVALLHPSVDLAPKIYMKVIAPFAMGFEEKIDLNREEVTEQGKPKAEVAEKGPKTDMGLKKTE